MAADSRVTENRVHVVHPEMPVHQAILQAVFLDVDGVLLDSLPQHLQFCAAKAREYGVSDVRIPTVEEFRRMVRKGVAVSPMLNFFLALGFPPALAQRGTEDYEREFMQLCRPAPFPGIEHMLGRMRAAGLALGLVTSNTKANVEPALAHVLPAFDPRCLFYFDRYPEPRDKAWCLAEGARILGLAPGDCCFVGDQPGDAAAARTAGVPFLGVSYGWGLQSEGNSVYTVDSVPAVADALLTRVHQPGTVGDKRPSG
jgi:phosphoglycolate phosphatase